MAIYTRHTYLKITDNHNSPLCTDPIIIMMPLPTAEPSESISFETIARLTLHKIKGTYLTITKTQTHLQ